MALKNAADFFAKRVGRPKLCGHKECTRPLPPRVDGERVKIGGTEACDHCWNIFVADFEPIPPILPKGVRRA
jgi:hypothetical protein